MVTITAKRISQFIYVATNKAILVSYTTTKKEITDISPPEQVNYINSATAYLPHGITLKIDIPHDIKLDPEIQKHLKESGDLGKAEKERILELKHDLSRIKDLFSIEEK